MIKYTKKLLLFLLLAQTLILFGCSVRNAPQVNYFTLLSMEQLGDSLVLGQFPDVHLGIGPVIIPESLKRTQIATRENHNEYQFNEYNRWAGVLEKDLSAVIADNIGVMLGIENIGFFPFSSHFSPTYRVAIDIQHLVGNLAGEAVLEARWSIVDSSGNTQLAVGRSTFQRKVDNNDYSGLVAAESYLVAELSKTLAKEIKTLATK